ncbi:MAG: hydrogenase maturation nickel metallochaperone HypA [Methanobacteriaceae archaeon]|jgi:hydrogenase nickel incorporation protein HypA/HybF|nr:hydrogenase maturation nickel metallochaperone HypA [Methanobacteriaceae archaeon]
MHELAMAQGIINSVIETANENNATEVTEIVIEIGKLVLINPEQLSFMLDVLCENTIVENAKFDIIEIPAEIECPECKFKGNANTDDLDHYAPIIECPKCKNKRVSILNGKDCIVRNIIIEQPN